MVTKGLTSITFKWLHPISQQGQLTGYKIKYRKRSDGKYNYLNIERYQSQAELTDLAKNTEYEIRVAGIFTLQGVGPYSKELIEKTKTGTLSEFDVFSALKIVQENV